MSVEIGEEIQKELQELVYIQGEFEKQRSNQDANQYNDFDGDEREYQRMVVLIEKANKWQADSLFNEMQEHAAKAAGNKPKTSDAKLIILFDMVKSVKTANAQKLSTVNDLKKTTEAEQIYLDHISKQLNKKTYQNPGDAGDRM